MLELCDGPYVCGFCPPLTSPAGEAIAIHFEAVSNLSSCIAILQQQLVYGHELDLDRPLPPPNQL